MDDRNSVVTNEQWYRPSPWHQKIRQAIFSQVRQIPAYGVMMLKKLTILVLLGLVILAVYLIVLWNQVAVPAREPYDKTGFVESSQFIQTYGNEYVMENNRYKLTLNNQNTTFVVLDKTTNITWRSNPDTSSVRFLDTMVVYYAGALGAATAMSVYDQAVRYNDYQIRITDYSIEILYEVGGKKNVDSSDFPEIITDERLQEKILSKLQPGTIDYRRVTEQSYVAGEVNGVQAWKLKDGIQTSVLNQLYRIFYDVCGYTEEDLAYDLELNGIVYEDKYAYVEVAIRYTLTEEGFDIRLINDSIFEKAKFPLVYIDVLPYFGFSGTQDEGYVMVPDGSGVLIDHNNSRSFALPYQQRIYGKELAVIRETRQNSAEMISLPLYGMKRNDSGFIAIAEEGAEMAAVHANVSTTDNPYNQAYYRCYFRESEVFQFSAINSSTTIIQWTSWYSVSDFNIRVMFVHEEEGSYGAMAKLFQSYLIAQGILTNKDVTNRVVLDLTVLGGYVVRENFLGFPYKTVKSLTNTTQAQQIVDELLSDGVTHINLIYKGWSNEGLKPTYMGEIEYDNATGTKRDFKALQAHLNQVGVNFFPEVYVNTAFTGANFKENEYAVRNVFGNTVQNYATNEATLYMDSSTRKYYTLIPSTYSSTLTKISAAFDKTTMTNIAFSDFGGQMYGTYHKKNTMMRTDTLELFTQAMQSNAHRFQKMMFRNPSLYAIGYADCITDVPTYGTNYQIVGLSVPFHQLVFSGYLDYSSKSFNLDDQYTYHWHTMKAIETASNISMTWSFESTIGLAETEYSYYYSTFYRNWYERVLNSYEELNQLGIYQSSLGQHEILKTDGTVTKSTYQNGIEIVFNYGISSFNYNGVIVPSNTYMMVKGAD
jgi:hypothetical protein